MHTKTATQKGGGFIVFVMSAFPSREGGPLAVDE